MLTLREDVDTNWANPAAASDTDTVQPLLTLVRALGAELYINGTRICPWCREDWGSSHHTCDPAPTRADVELATTGTAMSGKYAGRKVFRHTVCEPCGAFLPPDATSCPTCVADAAEFLASAPKDADGQYLPAIHFDMRTGDQR